MWTISINQSINQSGRIPASLGSLRALMGLDLADVLTGSIIDCKSFRQPVFERRLVWVDDERSILCISQGTTRPPSEAAAGGGAGAAGGGGEDVIEISFSEVDSLEMRAPEVYSLVDASADASRGADVFLAITLGGGKGGVDLRFASTESRDLWYSIMSKLTTGVHKILALYLCAV